MKLYALAFTLIGFYSLCFKPATAQVVGSNKQSSNASELFDISLNTTHAESTITEVKVVAYIPNWNNLNTLANTLDYAKLTHINIAFENADVNGNLSYNSNNTVLITKARAKGVKVLVSIGGGSESENATARAKYFNLISDANRSQFVSKIVAYIKLHQFDGIDVDLEGPAINADYGKFIKALSDTLKPTGKLLTSALSQGYGGANVQNATLKYFDFVNIMAYDATGPWDKNNPGQHSSYSLAESAIKYWKSRGLTNEQTILGVPFYGYGFGVAYRNYDYPYSEIVRNYSGAENKDQVGTTIYYNGIHTIKKKTILATQQAGGIMIWELSSDASGAKSLLLAIDQVIQGTDTLPVEPVLLTATAASSSQINLLWTDKSNNETSFKIEHSADGVTGWTTIATVGLDVSKYANTNLTANNAYFYRVRAENFTGNSNWSNIANATTSFTTAIATPTQPGFDFIIFPNPAFETINIGYDTSIIGAMYFDIYSLDGQLIKTLINNEQIQQGSSRKCFDISCLPDGIYFVKLTAGDFIKTAKFLIMR